MAEYSNDPYVRGLQEKYGMYGERMPGAGMRTPTPEEIARGEQLDRLERQSGINVQDCVSSRGAAGSEPSSPSDRVLARPNVTAPSTQQGGSSGGRLGSTMPEFRNDLVQNGVLVIPTDPAKLNGLDATRARFCSMKGEDGSLKNYLCLSSGGNYISANSNNTQVYIPLDNVNEIRVAGDPNRPTLKRTFDVTFEEGFKFQKPVAMNAADISYLGRLSREQGQFLQSSADGDPMALEGKKLRSARVHDAGEEQKAAAEQRAALRAERRAAEENYRNARYAARTAQLQAAANGMNASAGQFGVPMGPVSYPQNYAPQYAAAPAGPTGQPAPSYGAAPAGQPAPGTAGTYGAAPATGNTGNGTVQPAPANGATSPASKVEPVPTNFVSTDYKAPEEAQGGLLGTLLGLLTSLLEKMSGEKKEEPVLAKAEEPKPAALAPPKVTDTKIATVFVGDGGFRPTDGIPTISGGRQLG